MKEYRLAAWPELTAPFDRTAFRRMLSDMSHRHMSLAQLVGASGIRRQEVRDFIDMLVARGVISQRGFDRARLAVRLVAPTGRLAAPGDVEQPGAALRRPSSGQPRAAGSPPH